VNVGGLHSELGQAKEAQESYQRALPSLQKLVEATPPSSDSSSCWL
jgi:hypothetical protein